MQERRKVLIIDDEIDLSLLLQSYLTKKGYEVHITHTIAEGLVKLNDLHPSVLFLDNNLPDGIGWEVAPRIAQQYHDTFIYLLSAFHPSEPDMPAGSNYMLLEKPISIMEIDKHLATYEL